MYFTESCPLPINSLLLLIPLTTCLVKKPIPPSYQLPFKKYWEPTLRAITSPESTVTDTVYMRLQENDTKVTSLCWHVCMFNFLLLSFNKRMIRIGIPYGNH